MSTYIENQIKTALITLPWYIGIPGVLVGSVVLVLWLALDLPSAGCIDATKGAMFIGFLFWVIRQAIRLIWSVRVMTR